MLFAAACSNKNKGDDGPKKESTHEYETSVTENFLVKDGMSDYHIVFPKESPNR